MNRIQRQRTKGWRMPEGAIYVGRPTQWGNWAKPGDCADCQWGEHDGAHRPMTRADAVAEYRIVLEATLAAEASIGRMTPEELRLCGVSGVMIDPLAELRGATALACWCPLDQPCHADVLVELLATPDMLERAADAVAEALGS